MTYSRTPRSRKCIVVCCIATAMQNKSCNRIMYLYSFFQLFPTMRNSHCDSSHTSHLLTICSVDIPRTTNAFQGALMQVRCGRQFSSLATPGSDPPIWEAPNEEPRAPKPRSTRAQHNTSRTTHRCNAIHNRAGQCHPVNTMQDEPNACKHVKHNNITNFI